MTSEILILTAITAALIAGLFYAYSCSVNIGLARLSNAGYIAAMQAINKAILNPLFFVSFIGSLLLLPVSTFLHYQQPISNRFIFLLIATIIYIIGSFGVTIFGNVPLNEMLARFNLQAASDEEIANQRTKFELPWNRLHTIRTIASVISLVMVLIACVKG